MKSVVTGISGFIAGNLASALARDGQEVVGVGRSAPAPPVAGAVRFLPLDVCDFNATLTLLQREKPQTVYHLAASAVLQGAADNSGGARAMLETNVAGTWNVLEACRRAQIPVAVIVSSDKQYGALAVPPYDDEDGTGFINGGVYELTKAQQDQTARLYAGVYDVPAIRVARLANIYGPGDRHWTRIIPGTIRRTVRGEAPRVTAGAAGAALREYLFVEDCVAALRALANDAATRGNEPLRRADGKLARAGFNLGSEHRFAAAEVIAAVQQVLREEFGVVGPPPEVLPGTPGIFEPGSQFSRLRRIRALMPGYAPRDLFSGLRATIPWYLDRLNDGQTPTA